MLSFTFPWALGFLAATTLVALFYFLRMRFRRQPVSSTFLWSRLVEVNEGGARLRWRSVWLLLLQLLAVVALVLAVAGPQVAITTPVTAGTLYLLDTSASMGARDKEGLSRMDQARRAIAADRAGAPGPVAVFAGDRNIFTSADAGGLETFLATIQPGAGELAEGPAADILEAWLPAHPGPWTGVLVSDGGLDQGGTRLARLFPGRWRTLPVASQAPNLGITDLRLVSGASPGLQLTVFNGFPEAQTIQVALGRNQVPVTQREETVPPGTSLVKWNLPDLDTRPGLWRATLVHHTDALAADDAFTLAVDTPRKARILHLGPPDPFLQAAFPGADYQNRLGSSASGGPWDIVIAETLLPNSGTNLVSFGALPPGAPVFWGEPVSGTLSGPATAHPLSRWVPWDDVTLTEGRGLVVQPGATVLAEAGTWPVAATWERDGSRFLVLGFHTRNSNVGLTPVLPVLLRNFRQACVPQEANPLAANLRVGKTTVRAGSEAWKVVSSTAPSGAAGLEAVRRGGQWELTPREAGTFQWTDGADSGVLAAQMPASESDTAPRATVADSGVSGVPETGRRSQNLPLSPWLAVLAFGLLALEWRLWNGRFDPRSNRGLALLRGSSAAAALLALLGLALPWPTTNQNLALLFDTSASLGPELVEQQRQSALRLLDKLQPGDRVALVSFAEDPLVLSGLQPRDQARQTLDTVALSSGEGTGTNLRAALAVGAQILTDQPGSGSQVVFSDGRTNLGGDLDLSGDVRRFPISAVPLGRPLGGITSQGLDVPPSVRPGEQALVRWQGWTDQPRSVTLALAIDGAVRQTRKARLKTGANVEEFVVAAGETGTRKIEVTVSGAEGQALPSAQATGLLTVEGRTSVLVVRGGHTGSGLVDALGRQGLPVLVRGPQGLPDTPEGYQSLSAVVLDNVSAPSLTEGQQGRLKDWVAGGGGLLVVGGDGSLGRGEYYTSPLEDLLPVQTDNRQRLQFTRSRILFVVDHSGSMSEAVGQTTKLEAALGGIVQSLDVLTGQDEVGLLQFDSEASWVLPFTPLAQKKTIQAALDGFRQGGGTDMTKALDEVVLAFGHPGPVKRHVILLTDGQTGGEEAMFQEFTETMKAAQVTMTIIGIGNEVNDKLLGALAAGSDGVYYRAVGADIPAILHKETVRVTRDLIQEGHFSPLATGRDPVLDLGAAPPEVLGYLVTKPKALARLRWEAQRPDGERDPLYADWRFGAGKVAVFTSDSGIRWMAPWSGRPEYNRFWGQAVRSLETGEQDKTLGLELSVSASVARVVVEALDDQGRLRSGASLFADHGGRSYPLAEVAPGRYETSFPLDASGLQLVTVGDRAGPGRTWAWAWNPSGAELAQGGADWAGLGRLTATTGGLLQPLMDPAPPVPAWSWAPLALRDWLLGLALVLFLVELGLRSTSLGQLTAARAGFATWWRAQSRPWAKAVVAPVTRNEAEVERRTREAYKYLASRKREGGPPREP